jgi:hypothetical protein
LLPGGRDDQIRNAQFMGTSPGQPPPFNPDVEFSGLPHAFLSQPSSMGQGQPGLPPQAPAMANREPWRKRPYSGGFDTDLLMHYLGMR